MKPIEEASSSVRLTRNALATLVHLGIIDGIVPIKSAKCGWVSSSHCDQLTTALQKLAKQMAYPRFRVVELSAAMHWYFHDGDFHRLSLLLAGMFDKKIPLYFSTQGPFRNQYFLDCLLTRRFIVGNLDG